MVIVKFPTAEKRIEIVSAPTVENNIGLGDGWYMPTPKTYDSSTYKITALNDVGPTITYADDDSKKKIVVKNATRNTIGKSTMVLSLSDKKHMVWSDTSDNKDKEFPYELHKISIIKPTALEPTTYTYDGRSHTFGVNLAATDSMHPYAARRVTDNKYFISDTVPDDFTNAGDYARKYHINEYNHDYIEWSDGSYDDVNLQYKINKAAGIVSLSSTSANLTGSNKSTTINITEYYGTLTAVSSDTDVATASLSGNTITVAGVFDGSAIITVRSAGDMYHTSASATITVQTSNMVAKKKFSDASANEIVQMVKAADAGKLDLEKDCGWAVGQEKSFTLPAIAKSGTYNGVSWSMINDQPQQGITLVLVDTGANQVSNSGDNMSLVLPIKATSGQSTYVPHFVVSLKNCLTQTDRIDSDKTSFVGWKKCGMRKWCNGGFRKSMDTILPGIFKTFNVKEGAPGDSPVLETAQDNFSLFSIKEIVGSYPVAATGTGQHLKTWQASDIEYNALKAVKWYSMDVSHLKKSVGDNSSSYGYPWTRTTAYNVDNNQFVNAMAFSVENNTTVTSLSAPVKDDSDPSGYNNGNISPFGVL